MKKFLHKNVATILSLSLIASFVAPTQPVFANTPDFSQRYQKVYEGITYRYKMKHAKGYTIKYSVTGNAKKAIKLKKYSGTSTSFIVDTTKNHKTGKATITARFYKKITKDHKIKYQLVKTSIDNVYVRIPAKTVTIHTPIKELGLNKEYSFQSIITPKHTTSTLSWKVTTTDGKETLDATIDKNGTFKASKTGEYIITAMVQNDKRPNTPFTIQDTTTVKVIEELASPVFYSNQSNSLPTSDTPNNTPNDTPNDMDDKNDISSILSSRPIDDPNITDEEFNLLSSKLRNYLTDIDTRDSDGDGLIDEYEKQIGTDPNNADTDGDGLSDFFEHSYAHTDPLKADTDDNGISDADEDLDQDGLTNLEEAKLGTNPLEADTDLDGISDGDEIHLYKTNPLMADTDGDGISDGKEIELGLDPNNPDSNHNGILDGDEIFSITQSTTPQETDPRVIPNIKMDIPGNIIDTLSITKVPEDDFYLPSDIPGYIGAGYDFHLDGTFERATLSFQFDTSLLADPDFEPAIYYCDEKNQDMILLENQTLDKKNGIVSTEITHFSKYILLNKTAFEDIWNNDIRLPSDSTPLNNSLVIALSIDSSGSMLFNDPNGIRIQAAKAFIEKLKENDKAAIIDFDSTATVLSGLTNDKQQLSQALDLVDSSGGTDIGAGISCALDEVQNETSTSKYIILLTDGDGNYDLSLSQRAIECGVAIYTIGLGTDIDENLLQSIATSTGGKYYHATTASELNEIFEKTSNETIDYEKDTDQDGLSDYYETLIAEGKLLGFNGKRYYVDKNNPDTDGDGLLDGEEIYIASSPDTNGSTSKLCIKVNSDPNLRDTDGDGYIDSRDPNPLKWDISDRDLAMVSSLSYQYLPIGSVLDELSPELEEEANNDFYHIAQAKELKGWTVVETISDSTDLQMTVFKKDDNIIVACRGTESIKDWINNLLTYILPVGPQSISAKNEMKKILHNYQNCNFYTTGHSLGGHLAYDTGVVGIRTNKDAIKGVVTFNGLGFSPISFIDALDKTALLSKKSIVTNYHVTGDLVYFISFHIGNEIEYAVSKNLANYNMSKIQKLHILYTFFEHIGPFRP